jgi:hypothetical protein
MARGKDAVDVALTTSFGPSTLKKFSVITDQIPMDEDPIQKPRSAATPISAIQLS